MRRTLPLAALLVCLLALATGAQTASASRAQTTVFEDNAALENGSTRDVTLDQIRDFGVDTVRIALIWRRVAPQSGSSRKPTFDATDPASYDWAWYDSAIAGARARGLRVLLTVSGPVPRWATRSKRDQLTYPSPTEYGRFVTAVARRYASQVDQWTLWNEPNYPKFLLPQWVKKGKRKVPASPLLYRSLFLAGSKSLRAAGVSTKQILLGDTAPVGTSKVMSPLLFMRESLCLNAKWQPKRRCARLAIGGYAHHPYTKAAGPKYRPRSGDDVTIGVMSRVPRAVSRAARAGAITRGVPSYITEFGFQSAPDPFAATLEQQATYLGISERMAYENRSIASYAQYLMFDEPANLKAPALSRYEGFQTGIRLANGRVKPSYAAFRLPLAVKRSGRSVSIWGFARPAASVTPVEVVYRDRGSSTVRTVRSATTNATGYFTFRASYRAGRRWQLRWTSPTGEQLTGAFVTAY